MSFCDATPDQPEQDTASLCSFWVAKSERPTLLACVNCERFPITALQSHRNSCNRGISELTGAGLFPSRKNVSAMLPLSDTVHLSREGWLGEGGAVGERRAEGCDYRHVKS